jgi:hypothetical protein
LKHPVIFAACEAPPATSQDNRFLYKQIPAFSLAKVDSAHIIGAVVFALVCIPFGIWMLYKRKTYLDILAENQEQLNLPTIIRLYRISGILLIIVGAIPLIDVIVLLIADNYK